MSSHREAPEISKDPVADSTDVYAFVSPDRPDTVTLIANYIPLQKPDGGPNFYEFGDDVVYEIHISNRGKAGADITYQFDFSTQVRNPSTFLYNTGPITSVKSASWNRPQHYTVRRIADGKTNRQIAREMHLAEKTIKNYVSNLLTKLGFERRTEAAVFATKLELAGHHIEV